MMTAFSLPWGERCSAFEYGLVVLGPGEADAACWLTPSFDDPIAQAAFQVQFGGFFCGFFQPAVAWLSEVPG